MFFAAENTSSPAIWLLAGIGIGLVVAWFWFRFRRNRMLDRLMRGVDEIRHRRGGRDLSSRDRTADILNAVHDMHKKLRQREKRYRKAAKRFSSVINNMDVGVVVLDADYRVIFFNLAACDLLGVVPEDLKNRSLIEIVRNPEVEQAISRCLSGLDDVEAEFETTRGPRRTLQVRAGCMPRKSKAQSMLVFVDVSKLRQLENMRRDFVANVSHELKTPLASIKAYAETLRRGAINDQENRIEFVRTIEEQANRLHQLIIDLIQLARIEQGRETLVISDVELTRIARERVYAFKDAAEKNGIELSSELPDAEVWTRVDEEGIETILDNLLSNAIRYTPEGGQVKLVCRSEDNRVILSVIDTGIGIAPEQQERVFERFYRVDKARSREKGGTGLGLSIVKHLVQSMGGDLSLKSSVGSGSTFSVSFPDLKTPANG